ncbi:MAG: MFS transporter [Anaeromyxobacter sp.]
MLFTTRALRLFAYGLTSVVLVLHLEAAGLGQAEVGLLLSLALLGDTAISLLLTTRADRFGRRRTLAVGALLMVFAAAVFATSTSFWLLLVAATAGVLSPSGNEVGPFLAVEQAALSQELPAQRRTWVFAWYGLAGSLATAAGSLVGGGVASLLLRSGRPPLEAYRGVMALYGLLGLGLAALFLRLSPGVEVPAEQAPRPGAPWHGLSRSRRTVLGLSALFSLDAFAGGFVVQSFVAWWFHARFGLEPAALGAVFFGANLLAGLSSLAAAGLARRIGLVNTMVATHLPSNVLLLVVPLMPTLPLAVGVLLARFAISQMDVPTRQSYTMAVVNPGERAAAAGVTGIARTVGSALSPLVAGPLYASAALASVPFFLAGGLKILYDLVLWRRFSAVRPPEEQRVSSDPDPAQAERVRWGGGPRACTGRRAPPSRARVVALTGRPAPGPRSWEAPSAARSPLPCSWASWGSPAPRPRSSARSTSRTPSGPRPPPCAPPRAPSARCRTPTSARWTRPWPRWGRTTSCAAPSSAATARRCRRRPCSASRPCSATASPTGTSSTPTAASSCGSTSRSSPGTR